jgi:2-aminobenzoate-CoA ligase
MNRLALIGLCTKIADCEASVKDIYPLESTCPQTFLVPPENQPDYADFHHPDIDTESNIGDHLADRHVRKGNGNMIAAVHFESGRTYTFQELVSRSSRLAAGLVGQGLRVGDRVAYCAPNDPEILIVMLAIWKAGGVVVPLPAHARASELPGYFENAGIRILFTHRRLEAFEDTANIAQQFGVQRVVAFGNGPQRAPYDTDQDLYKDELVGLRGGGDHIAILWHTGGTTGRPKGCYHTHRRFLAGGYAFGLATGVGPGERWSAAAPTGHALGILHNTVFTILHGATAVFVEKFSDHEHVLEAIDRYKITTFTALMASWAKLADIVANQNPPMTSSLRRSFAMWQSASAADVYGFWKKRGVELLNNFGSTSFATWVLIPPLGEPSPQAALGKALPGYRVEAVSLEDGKVTVLPAGEIGQMAVRGPTGLTYWNLPERQRTDVIDGWTLSDDLIRFDNNGFAHYLGRSDSMISTSGFKVAPVEVESVLSRHPAVAEVAVVPAPCPIRQQIVAAYIRLEPGSPRDEALRQTLQDLVKAELSSYKAPRLIEFVDRLPRDAIGKVQVRVLKEWAERDVVRNR